MRNITGLLLAGVLLLPAAEVRQHETRRNIDRIQTLAAHEVRKAAAKGWYNVAVYLPDVKEFERAKAIREIQAKGYKVTQGSGVNEVFLSW